MLADVGRVDAVITDPPYTKRNKIGFRSGATVKRGGKKISRGDDKHVINYEALSREDARTICEFAAGHSRYWFIAFNDHIGFRWLEEDMQDLGWYTFAPVVWVKPNGPPRMAADGPASSCEYLLVARPKRRIPEARRGSRVGWYRHGIVNGNSNEQILVGQKPLRLVRRLLRDYTLPGDLIMDPYSGSATTGRACQLEGRNFIGAEIDPETHAKGAARLAEPFTAPMFRPAERASQEKLF